MKIVIDTNVVASAIFFGGKPAELLLKVLRKEHYAVVSQDILDEYQDTLDYLTSKYPNRKAILSKAMLFASMEIIEPVTEVHICRDPDDDKFLACAIDGN